MDRGEAHLRRGGTVRPEVEGRSTRKPRLGDVIQKIGYWIDQLSAERRELCAVYRRTEELEKRRAEADYGSMLLHVAAAEKKEAEEAAAPK